MYYQKKYLKYDFLEKFINNIKEIQKDDQSILIFNSFNQFYISIECDQLQILLHYYSENDEVLLKLHKIPIINEWQITYKHIYTPNYYNKNYNNIIIKACEKLISTEKWKFYNFDIISLINHILEENIRIQESKIESIII